jgi:hypothetical protein
VQSFYCRACCVSARRCRCRFCRASDGAAYTDRVGSRPSQRPLRAGSMLRLKRRTASYGRCGIAPLTASVCCAPPDELGHVEGGRHTGSAVRRGEEAGCRWTVREPITIDGDACRRDSTAYVAFVSVLDRYSQQNSVPAWSRRSSGTDSVVRDRMCTFKGCMRRSSSGDGASRASDMGDNDRCGLPSDGVAFSLSLTLPRPG